MIDLKSYILNQSDLFRLDPKYVAAIIWTESKGSLWASRYESAFYIKYIANLMRNTLPGYVPDPSLVSLMTEKKHRATSWGVMQVMGETAREFGFKEEYLLRLIIPEINIHFGCKILASHLKGSLGDYRKALQRYNGGGDINYHVKVKESMEQSAVKEILR